jgi:hypothetical protein
LKTIKRNRRRNSTNAAANNSDVWFTVDQMGMDARVLADVAS